jgi:LPXTG-site transpeptidase (sortase) family protein
VPKTFRGEEEIVVGEPIYDSFTNEYWTGGYAEDFSDSNSSNQSTGNIKPDRVIIDEIGVDTIISQPQSRDVNVLDQYLTKGAVYYPGSGTVEQGNMFVFGHSTGLSVVQNQAYKAFNNFNKLENGDLVTIEADGSKYQYKVSKVQLLDEDDALITFDNNERKLTLSTCNTFGAKQERWVVEADFYREL